jgi:uncharacterized membrane protein
MSQLLVVGFKQDMYRASIVLNTLAAMNDDWGDAVAVYRGYNGKLRVDQSYQMTTGQGAGWGALWSSLIGATLAIPFTAGASGAPAGAIDAGWWKDEFGIPEDLVKNIGGMVQNGDSAIFALLRLAAPHVAEQLRRNGGAVLQTTLTGEQSRKVASVLNGSERPLAKAS